MLQNRIYTYAKYMKQKYGTKVYRIGLSIGEPCPHRVKNGGCIFCIPGSFVGEYQQEKKSISEQSQIIMNRLREKINVDTYIAYFQDETSTAGNVDFLRKCYNDALIDDSVKELIISTRPDFIDESIVDLINSIEKPVTIELGMQTIHNKSLEFLRRGHSFEDFEKAMSILEKTKARIGVHVITGIPIESEEERLETIRYVANNMNISEVKLHHLVVYKDTDLAKVSEEMNLKYYTLEEYFAFLAKAFPILRKDQVISRIFTSNVRRTMTALNQFPKTKVDWLNKLGKYLHENDVVQGENP